MSKAKEIALNVIGLFKKISVNEPLRLITVKLEHLEEANKPKPSTLFEYFKEGKNSKCLNKQKRDCPYCHNIIKEDYDKHTKLCSASSALDVSDDDIISVEMVGKRRNKPSRSFLIID